MGIIHGFASPEALSSSSVAGVDEAGRGPLAGPVVAAAVVLDPRYPIEGLKDSKKLTAGRREALADVIRVRAACWAIGTASVLEIDRLNILQATLLAMARAVGGLGVVPGRVLVDGNRIPNQLSCPTQAVVRGDQTVACISAASILAKTHRDGMMLALDGEYPGYGFKQHKGYGTRQHLAALEQLGPTSHHRRSFAPVRRALGRHRTAPSVTD
jgi:ribonuclease HII